MKREAAAAGATLLEILVAMLILVLVAAGILTAFVFSRRLSWRSGSELSALALARETAEQLRGALRGWPAPNGLLLDSGIYVDQNMAQPPAAPGVATTALQALNLPGDFRARFQTNEGRTPAPTFRDHGDGRLYVVEGLNDIDGDGERGLDLNADGQPDLFRVRLKVRFTTPQT